MRPQAEQRTIVRPEVVLGHITLRLVFKARRVSPSHPVCATVRILSATAQNVDSLTASGASRVKTPHLPDAARLDIRMGA
jgi:hypothetical protein